MTSIEWVKESINYFKGFQEGDNITITADFVDNVETIIERLEMLEEERANYDWEKDVINSLQQENQELKEKYNVLMATYEHTIEQEEKILDSRVKYIEENEKLTKAIEIIKKKIRFSTYESLKNQIVLFSNDFGIHIYTIYCETKEDYELMIEVLNIPK